MTKLAPRKLCNGCMACYNSCPNKAITIEEDKLGFLFPIIDTDKCIDCGLCSRVCSVYHNEKEGGLAKSQIMAAYSKDKNIRIKSSSGGMFSEIAKYYLDNGGYITGAVFNQNYSLSHIVTNDKGKLNRLRGSKYIQSDTRYIYKKIKNLLDNNKKVLMCGTPCQVKGLLNYLKKDYENLLTCDLICHGVNSPIIFRKYLSMLEKKYKSKVKRIEFRNKKYGWNMYSTKILFKNKKHYIKDHYSDKFMLGFLKYHYYLRESCYNCGFRSLQRVSDITLADFWGIDKTKPEMDDMLGTSLVLINSKKGEDVFNRIKENLVYQKMRIGDIHNNISNSPNRNINSSKFLNELSHIPFDKLWNKYIPDKRLNIKFQEYIKKTLIKITLLWTNWREKIKCLIETKSL